MNKKSSMFSSNPIIISGNITFTQLRQSNNENRQPASRKEVTTQDTVAVTQSESSQKCELVKFSVVV